MPASKKPKFKIRVPSIVAERCVASSNKKFSSFGASKKMEATSSSKRPAPPKPAYIPAPIPMEEVEVESCPELVKRKKKKKKTETKELESASMKVALSDPSPYGRENVSTTQARVIPEFETT